MLSAFQTHIRICHRCKHSQTQRGGCAGPCPCTIDAKDIIWHAQRMYCPAGKYPFAGLGSVIGWLLWHLRIVWVMRKVFRWKIEKCNCAERQKKMNRFWKWLFGKVKK